MTAQYLTWSQAFDLFADHLVQFQTHRARGLDVAQAGAALGISPEAAQKYESTICRMVAAVKNGAASVAPEAARQAHINPSEESQRHE